MCRDSCTWSPFGLGDMWHVSPAALRVFMALYGGITNIKQAQARKGEVKGGGGDEDGM